MITSEGITVDGDSLITEKANGEIHIGKNSLITTTEAKTLPNGKEVQPLYAKDDEGNLIKDNQEPENNCLEDFLLKQRN